MIIPVQCVVDAGVHKLGERLQEISNSASKEFSLEKAMAKMKGEWEHVSVLHILDRFPGYQIAFIVIGCIGWYWMVFVDNGWFLDGIGAWGSHWRRQWPR